MANWKHVIEIGDVFGNEDLSFPERRDTIVTRFREDTWIKNVDTDGEMADMLEELADAEDPDEFDVIWSYIYDWADGELLWIETTHSRPKVTA